MSACVVDSSAWVSIVLTSDKRGQGVIDKLEAFEEWWAPAVFDLDVLDAPLLTTDARLARSSGPRCEFLLVEAN